MHKPKSLASDLFAILVDMFPIGYDFTSAEFKAIETIKGLNASEGAVQGFLNRALKKKNLIVSNTYKSPKGQICYIYKVINHTPWGFHTAGIGSHEGRQIKQSRHINMGIEENITVIEVKKPEVHFVTDQAVKDWANKCAADGTATDEIMLRLSEVMALVEGQREMLSKLTDYSDDEIADEVKRRFHSK